MKKILYAVMFLLGLSIIISCHKTSIEPEKKGEVSIIGEWVSYNLDVLDEFARGVTYREASNDMKVEFTKDGMATFTYDGNSGSYPSTFKGKYELLEKDGVKFLDFPEGLYDKDQSGYYISSSFDPSDGGSLVIRFGKMEWDWYDQWYFGKAK